MGAVHVYEMSCSHPVWETHRCGRATPRDNPEAIVWSLCDCIDQNHKITLPLSRSQYNSLSSADGGSYLSGVKRRDLQCGPSICYSQRKVRINAKCVHLT